jgi:hypothetical protein
MYEPDAAARVEALYTNAGHEALLKDGSAYSDNFTGGAAESHFCPSSMGWGPTLRAANPLVLLAFLLSNLYSFLRVAVLLLLELGLALVDFVRGLSRGHDFARELKFILARVSISICCATLSSAARSTSPAVCPLPSTSSVMTNSHTGAARVRCSPTGH